MLHCNVSEKISWQMSVCALHNGKWASFHLHQLSMGGISHASLSCDITLPSNHLSEKRQGTDHIQSFPPVCLFDLQRFPWTEESTPVLVQLSVTHGSAELRHLQ